MGCLLYTSSSPTIVSYLTQHEAELEAIGMNIDPNMPVHPTFLYESLWCLLGFVLIAWYTKRRRFDGELTLLYTAWYGAGRAVIEGPVSYTHLDVYKRQVWAQLAQHLHPKNPGKYAGKRPDVLAGDVL